MKLLTNHTLMHILKIIDVSLTLNMPFANKLGPIICLSFVSLTLIYEITNTLMEVI